MSKIRKGINIHRDEHDDSEDEFDDYYEDDYNDYDDDDYYDYDDYDDDEGYEDY